ncbi:MAG: FAD-dependent oxidoreductase [Pseudomonadota bacterium]
MAQPATRIALVGAGHAHIELVRQAHRLRAAGCELVLIDPARFWYSGAAAGVLSGAVSHAEASFDPSALARANGVRAVVDRVERIDLQTGRLHLASGSVERFDQLSLNTGSRAAPSRLIDQGALPEKPVSNWALLKDRFEAARGRLAIVIIGAGATGVEAAANLGALALQLGAKPHITLVDSGEPLSDWPAPARWAAMMRLAERGVSLVEAEALSLSDGGLALSNGETLAADLAMAAAGLQAALPAGLGADETGLPVRETLQWTGSDRVFAVGDCARIVGHERPRLGVFGVRAAPVLLENLIRVATGRGILQRYRPQEHWLSILDLGEGQGVARYGEFSWSGRSVLWLKRWIDRRFMARYRIDDP